MAGEHARAVQFTHGRPRSRGKGNTSVLLFSLSLPFILSRLSVHGIAPSIFKLGLPSPLILSGKTFFIDLLTDVPGNSISNQVDNDSGLVHCLSTWHPDPSLFNGNILPLTIDELMSVS